MVRADGRGPRAAATSSRRSAAVASGIDARPEDDEAAVPDAGREVSEARAERSVVRGAGVDRRAGGTGRQEASTMTLGEVEPRPVRGEGQGPGSRVGLEVQDRDVDVRHTSSRCAGRPIAG